ncbi:QRFP-like peptide receptor [Acropora palmata]|uniref:QRFP-like peptide receptor n=1 Tax=Acropora palmata TaxID=6131 RepID=UPI003DA02787
MYTGFAIFFSLLIVINLVGNTLVILAVTLNRSMRSPINFLLINLATADMIVAVFIGIPVVIAPSLSHPQGTDGVILCKIFTGGNIGWIGALASIFSLVAIAIERYGAVMYPHSRKGKLTKTKLLILIVTCWSLSALWSIPGFIAVTYIEEFRSCGHSWSKPIFGHFYTVGWSVVAGVIPLGLMGFLYSRMVYRLWIRKDNIREETQKALKRHRKRVTKMVVFVTVIYVLCWVPELLIYFLGFTGSITLVGIHHTIASALIVFNSSVNPIVYSLQSSQFRKHLSDLICCKRNRISALNSIVATSSTPRKQELETIEDERSVAGQLSQATAETAEKNLIPLTNAFGAKT